MSYPIGPKIICRVAVMGQLCIGQDNNGQPSVSGPFMNRNQNTVMKKILAPTDFSDAAQNSITYAVHLALQSNAQLILFHAYHVSPLTVEIPVSDLSSDEVRNRSLASLEATRADILFRYGANFDVLCDCGCGFAVDVIHDYALENEVDLIVMGMQGGDYVTERLVGSTSTALMQDAPCPVLVIDKDVRFAEVRKMVLACDYVKIPSFDAFVQLREFAGLFGAPWIYVLNVMRRVTDGVSSKEAHSIQRIREILRHTGHSVHTTENTDIVEGINHFSGQVGADMVVMIPRRHSVWRDFFYSRLSKRMAFHIGVPLLILQP